MIRGTVSSGLEAVVRLSLRGPEKMAEVEAIVDTGFNGTLILPPKLVATLDLRPTSRSQGVLADGQVTSFDLYEAIVFWNGRLLRVAVGVVDAEPLLGMSLLYGHELAIQVLEGGEVFIEQLASS